MHHMYIIAMLINKKAEHILLCMIKYVYGYLCVYVYIYSILPLLGSSAFPFQLKAELD